MSESILAQLKYRPKAVCLCVLTILHNHACYVRWGSLVIWTEMVHTFYCYHSVHWFTWEKDNTGVNIVLNTGLATGVDNGVDPFFQVIHVMINMVTLSLSTKSWCTLCLKKRPTCKRSVTLSNLNRFSKFLHYWKAYKIRYKTNTTFGLDSMQDGDCASCVAE